MAHTPPSLIVVGGGIVGLTLAAAAKARGHAVTIVAETPTGETASGVAAGMIAPALEALNDPDPAASYGRLKAAQAVWFELFDAWPAAVQGALIASQQAGARYVWSAGDADVVTSRFDAMGVATDALSEGEQAAVASGYVGVRVAGEMLIEAHTLLEALGMGLPSRQARVCGVTATSVTLESGEVLAADAVVVASGFGSRGLVPGLVDLTPIKGHILDIDGRGGFGVTRSAVGYLADYGDSAKFGATMQMGQDDPGVEPDVVDALTARAEALFPNLDLNGAVGRAAIRAASPDGWPIIGRDAGSGVYVATAMRRNGYVFAPLAAKILLALIAGETPAEALLYDPGRF